MPFDILRFDNALDSIQDLSIDFAPYPNMPAYQQMSDNVVSVELGFRCSNGPEGMQIKALQDSKEALSVLQQLQGIGLVDIKEQSTIQGLIPYGDTTIASFQTGSKLLQEDGVSYQSNLQELSLQQWKDRNTVSEE